MEIEGNELADEHAKRAAAGDISHIDDLPDLLKKCLLVSIAALKANWKKSIPQCWRKVWLNSPQHAKIFQIDSKLPNHQIYRTLSCLPCRAPSILIQLHTNHVSLNAFLKKIKALDSALCKKCHQPETIVHYLKYCKQYTEQCNHLRHKAGKASHSIHQLLGDPKIIPATLHYIQSTHHFDKYTNIAPPSE